MDHLTAVLVAAIVIPLLGDLWWNEAVVWRYMRAQLVKTALVLCVVGASGEAVAETSQAYASRQARALEATAKSRRETICPRNLGGPQVRMACWVDFSRLIIRIREMPHIRGASRREGEFRALLQDLDGITEHYKGNPV